MLVAISQESNASDILFHGMMAAMVGPGGGFRLVSVCCRISAESLRLPPQCPRDCTLLTSCLRSIA